MRNWLQDSMPASGLSEAAPGRGKQRRAPPHDAPKEAHDQKRQHRTQNKRRSKQIGKVIVWPRKII